MALFRYATQTGDPCPRTMRADGTVQGDGACHSCGLGAACPLADPWADSGSASSTHCEQLAEVVGEQT